MADHNLLDSESTLPTTASPTTALPTTALPTTTLPTTTLDGASIDGEDWRAPNKPTDNQPAAAPHVPEPAAAVMLLGLAAMVLLMTVLRWRFDRMSEVPASPRR